MELPSASGAQCTSPREDGPWRRSTPSITPLNCPTPLMKREAVEQKGGIRQMEIRREAVNRRQRWRNHRVQPNPPLTSLQPSWQMRVKIYICKCVLEPSICRLPVCLHKAQTIKNLITDRGKCRLNVTAWETRLGQSVWNWDCKDLTSSKDVLWAILTTGHQRLFT